MGNLYWDDANGRVTDNKKQGVPIYENENGIWTESWWVDKSQNLAIDFAYTQLDRDLHLVYYSREAHFKRHNVDPKFLRNIGVPTNVFKILRVGMSEF